MSRKLVIRAEAEAELAEAFGWYESRLPGLGARFLLSVEEILSAIVRNPRQYPRIHRTVHRALTHRFPYEVLYIEDGERVVILAVFHAKRKPKDWRQRT